MKSKCGLLQCGCLSKLQQARLLAELLCRKWRCVRTVVYLPPRTLGLTSAPTMRCSAHIDRTCQRWAALTQHCNGQEDWPACTARVAPCIKCARNDRAAARTGTAYRRACAYSNTACRAAAPSPHQQASLPARAPHSADQCDLLAAGDPVGSAR